MANVMANMSKEEKRLHYTSMIKFWRSGRTASHYRKLLKELEEDGS